MDWRLAHWLNGFAVQHDRFEDSVARYEQWSQFLFVGLLAVIFLIVWRNRTAGARAAVAATAGTALALALGRLISELVQRPRPFVDHPALHVYGSRAADFSFPSDHATAAFAIATAIVLRSRGWGAVALLMAAVLSVGRVIIGVHYPTDVIAGAALGSAAALALWLVVPVRRDLDRIADRLARLRDGLYRRLVRS